MVLNNVIVGVTILVPRLCFVSRVLIKVSASFTNLSSLAVAAFDLVCSSLSVLRFVVMLLYPLVIILTLLSS